MPAIACLLSLIVPSTSTGQVYYVKPENMSNHNYTILLFGYKLYYCSDRKYLHWINNLKPLLDSYYAPYKIHTRFWTGFFLLVRCVLYIVFLLFGEEDKSALAITTYHFCLHWICSRAHTHLQQPLCQFDRTIYILKSDSAFCVHNCWI